MYSRSARFIIVLLTMVEPFAHAQDRTQARSMVISRGGIVATSQVLASQAGAEILARGGNAIDAAIAANAVLQVVEPMSNGMGGDLFAIYRDAKTGKLTGINASGWAPKGLSIDFLRSKGMKTMPRSGIHTVTVPGCVDGWAMLHGRFGRLKWAELFEPAIYYAEHGFPVTEIISEQWINSTKKLAADENARRVYLPNGAAPRLGGIFRNPELARAFRLVAQNGRDAFYKGEIAQAILTTSGRLGGTMKAADLAEFQAEWVAPLSTGYRGWTVYELPPNGQGIAALEMLNILRRLPLWKPDADGYHMKIEAQKLAYADLARYIADPRFSKVPVAGLLSEDYAAARAKEIDFARANCTVAPGNPPEGAGDTVYFAAVDKDGNIVSMIQSLYQGFGSGIAVDGMGFHLQNRGALFTLDASHPNALAPRKRPFHTIIPAFMEKGNLHIGFGIMGGFNQAQAHAQFVSNIVDHEMNIQSALEAPRFTKLTFGGCDVNIEGRVPEKVREVLKMRGHDLKVLGDFSNVVGGGQAVLHDSVSKVNYGASDPRKDGAAMPEPAPYFRKTPLTPAAAPPPAQPKRPAAPAKGR